MDSKTKHRILGILVVAGLIVLMLPLFQNNREFSSNKAAINPPPFPDQSVEASAKTDTQTDPTPPRIITTTESAQTTPPALANQQPDEAITQNHTETTQTIKTPEIQNPALPSQSKLESTTPPEAVSPQQTAQAAPKEMSLKEMDDEVASLNNASSNPDTNANSNQQTVALLESTVKALSEQEHKTKISRTVTKAESKHQHRKKTNLAALMRAPIDNNGLFKLKNAAYVVQVGSYSSKPKAIKLVNQLRSKGYHAFIQQYSTDQGNSIHVFVGPEKKQTAARVLATELEKEARVHGTVVSYKPLAL